MKSLKLITCGWGLTMAVLGAGCSVDTAETDEAEEMSTAEAVSTRVEPGKWKLYSKPFHEPSAFCDVHTALELVNSGGATARLHEAVSGTCKLAVMPNPRSFKLRLTDVSCGSPFYEGKLRVNGKLSTITIQDNRHRTCRDLSRGKIIVTETVPSATGPITTTKFSFDGAPPAVDVTVQGNLVRTFGIGGENTGSSIATTSGLLELVLGDWQSAFVAGRTARVTGERTTLSGVETHDRPAIVVRDMLVCPAPGTLNCMPGPNVRLSNLCAGANRSWVQDNCAGVSYVD